MKPTNKTLLFAQHLGQQVLYKDLLLTLQGISAADLGIQDSGGEILRMHRNTVILTGDFSGIGIQQTGTARIEECTLLLRPIEQLTDDEAIQCAKICGVLDCTIWRKSDYIDITSGNFLLHISHSGYISFNFRDALYNNRGIFEVFDTSAQSA